MKCLSGSLYTVMVDSLYLKVTNIMKSMQKIYGVKKNSYFLLYQRKELHESQTLLELGITKREGSCTWAPKTKN